MSEDENKVEGAAEEQTAGTEGGEAAAGTEGAAQENAGTEGGENA